MYNRVQVNEIVTKTTVRGKIRLNFQDDRDTTQLLHTLVSINSENPDMNPSAAGEKEIAHFIKDYLDDIGLETVIEDVLCNRPNVYGILRSEKKVKETIVLEAHMDTVPIQNCIGPKYENGILYGRGACDTKGSIAAMLLALRQLVKKKAHLPVNVVFLATVDEEFKYRGVLKAIDFLKGMNDFQYVGAVVGEPTDLRLVTAHKSCLRWSVKVTGKAAHSGEPEKGINAIYIMTEFIEQIRNKWQQELTENTHPLLGRGSFNIGTITGGTQVNIVPPFCEIVMERRLLPSENDEMILKSVDGVIASLERKHRGAKIEREQPFLTDYTLDTNSNELIVTKMLRSIEHCLQKFTEVKGVQYGTDASKLAALGHIPSVVFGPGDISYAHTDCEEIAIEHVVKAKEIYAHVINNW